MAMNNFCAKCMKMGLIACVCGLAVFGPKDVGQPPAHAIGAIAKQVAGTTGAGSPFLQVADQITGVARSGIWPHGKPERPFGPTGPTGLAGAG
jgi:hypothetical protein